MPLNAGDIKATTGMAKSIYDAILAEFEPIDGISEENMPLIHEGWQKLSYAIAKGVISHIIDNMEIKGIKTKGNVETSVSGTISESTDSGHTFNLTGTENNVVFTQSNDGTGHVS